jgi:Ca2+-binding RTX toxin-like protein
VTTLGVVDGDLVVVGTGGNDAFLFSQGTDGKLVVWLNGATVGTFASAGVNRIVAHGLGGNDALVVSPGISLSAWLYGGTGNDLLVGGSGNNVLLGGSGNDLLIGGPGRDLLIGGSGADVLLAGSGQDILIAGTTVYDSNPQALQAILAEWSSSRDFATRVAQLQGTMAGGLNGTYVLTSNTVIDDNAVDLLVAGPARDWLFMNFQGTGLHDIALDARLQDVLTDINPH